LDFSCIPSHSVAYKTINKFVCVSKFGNRGGGGYDNEDDMGVGG